MSGGNWYRTFEVEMVDDPRFIALSPLAVKAWVVMRRRLDLHGIGHVPRAAIAAYLSDPADLKATDDALEELRAADLIEWDDHGVFRIRGVERTLDDLLSKGKKAKLGGRENNCRTHARKALSKLPKASRLAQQYRQQFTLQDVAQGASELPSQGPPEAPCQPPWTDRDRDRDVDEDETEIRYTEKGSKRQKKICWPAGRGEWEQQMTDEEAMVILEAEDALGADAAADLFNDQVERNKSRADAFQRLRSTTAQKRRRSKPSSM